MGNHEFVNILETLLPRIQESHDPEGVMLKYAGDKNFAPAQLEKLAQVYNVAKTLTFMDKAASRGGSFRVIETEKLLARYTQPKPRAKAAGVDAWLDMSGPVKSASSNPDSIDAWIDSDVEKVASFQGFPDIRALEEQAADRTARSESESALDVMHKQASAAIHAAVVTPIDRATLHQVIFDQREDLRESFAKAADTIFSQSIPFNEVEEDAYDLFGADTKSAADALAFYLKQANVNAPRFDPAAPRRRRLAVDRHHLADYIKQAANGMAFEKAALTYEEAVLGKAPETTRQLGASPGDAPRPSNERRELPNAVSPDDVVVDQESKPEKGEKGDSKPSGENPAFKAIDDLLNTGPKSVMAPYQGMADFISHIQPSKNKGQMKVDRAMHDEHHISSLQRLMVTDPIISEADPRKVVQIANTIRTASPDASRDGDFLRFAIREALQYDGVPTHTYKDLATLQDTQSKTKKINLESEEMQYGRGR